MAAKNEAKIKFTAETQEFDAAIKQSNKEMSTLRTELRLNDAEMKNVGTSVEGLAKKQNILQKEHEAQKNKTKALASELESAKKIYGEDSQEVAKLTRQLNVSKTAEQNIEREIKNTNSALENQKKQTDKVTLSQKDLKKGLDSVGKASGVVAGATVAAGAGAIKAFSEVKEGSDAAIKATGATGKAADEVKESYKKIAGSVKGDFSTIGATLGEVETRFNFTGKEAEDCTTKFIKFAKITNTDATESVKLVSRAMGDAGIEAKNYSKLLDMLAVASQKSGISISTLTEMLTKYGAPMRSLGFDTQESIALFSQWEKAGVNTSIAFSGMKKAISNWGKEGKDGRVEFQKTLEEIKKAPNIASATTKAIEVFGSKAGPDLADAIQNGRFEYSGFLNDLKKSKNTVNNTAKELSSGLGKGAIAVQNLKLAGAEAGESLLTQLGPTIDTATKKTQGFAKYAQENGDKVASTIKTIGIVAGTAFTINKVAKFGNSLVDVGKGVKSVASMLAGLVAARTADTAATTTQTAAQVGLNTAMNVNPVIIMGTALLGLAGTLVYLNSKTEELPKAAKDAENAYKDMHTSVLNNGKEVQNQFGVYDHWKEQLDDIVDANGNIKKGHEEQAKVITGQLSEALGIELKIVNGQIKGYDKLGKKIDNAIQKKKAEALLDANKKDYQDDIKKESEYAQQIAETSSKISDREEKLKGLKEQFKKISDEFNQWQKGGDGTGKLKDWGRRDEFARIQSSIKAEEDALNEDKATLSSQKKAYAEAAATIENYDNLMVASRSNSVKKMNNANTRMLYNLKSATTGTLDELFKQKEAYEQKVNEAAAAYRRGDISKAALEEAKHVYKYTKNQLSKMKDDAGFINAGKKIGKDWANGVKLGTFDFFQKNPIKVNAKVSGTAKVKGTLPGKNGLIKIGKNAEGNIIKSPILTTFAEDGPEAAIPINDKPRSRALWIETGKMMGLLNEETGNRRIQDSVSMSETNTLLRQILAKDSNMYVDGRKMSQATSASRNMVDGVSNALAGRGIAIE